MRPFQVIIGLIALLLAGVMGYLVVLQMAATPGPNPGFYMKSILSGFIVVVVLMVVACLCFFGRSSAPRQ